MWQANKDIVWRSKEDMLVLLNTKSGLYFTVNQTGANLWLSITEKGLSLEDAIAKIKEDFDDVPDEAKLEQECEKLIKEWTQEELLVEKVAE